MKILEIEHKFDNLKQERLDILELIEKNNNRIWIKLDQILEKIDDKFVDLAILQNEHNQFMKNCQKNK